MQFGSNVAPIWLTHAIRIWGLSVFWHGPTLWLCYFNARKPSIHSSFTWISRICLFYTSILDVGVWPCARQRHATCPGMPKQYADAAPPSRRPEQLNYRVKGSCETTFGEQSPFETHVLCNCHFFIAGNRKTSKLENDFLLSSGWIFDGF